MKELNKKNDIGYKIMSDAIEKMLEKAAKNEWKYTGNFNELAGMLLYSIIMKYLVNEGRIDEVNNPKLMAAAAKEIGLTNEKIADAMIKAGRQLKDAIELEKAIEEFSEVVAMTQKERSTSE